MKTKDEIVRNWLPRYTGEKLENFGKYILLTNFSNYVTLFAKWNKVKVVGNDRPMQCATADGITIINFGMGSPTAATVMDLLSSVSPKAVLFLGKCGGLKKRNKIGDLILLCQVLNYLLALLVLLLPLCLCPNCIWLNCTLTANLINFFNKLL